jgi:hypothetical protein
MKHLWFIASGLRKKRVHRRPARPLLRMFGEWPSGIINNARIFV